jgi:hypothetical protein
MTLKAAKLQLLQPIVDDRNLFGWKYMHQLNHEFSMPKAEKLNIA